jgi:hypothetical protein
MNIIMEHEGERIILIDIAGIWNNKAIEMPYYY